jgi:hypothetical protein
MSRSDRCAARMKKRITKARKDENTKKAEKETHHLRLFRVFVLSCFRDSLLLSAAWPTGAHAVL